MLSRIQRLWAWAVTNPDRTVLSAASIATAARLGYVIYLGDDLGGPDSSTYDAAGWDLVRGGLLSADVAGQPYWPPGYPLLVAAHYAVFGRHPVAIQITQVVLIGSLTWLSYRFAQKVAGPFPALLVGLAMSLSLAWLALAHPLMYEPWLALFLVAALLCLAKFGEDSRLIWAFGAGLLVGVAAALQDKFLTLVPVLAAWVLINSRRRRGGMPGLTMLLVGVAVVVAPLAIRNLVIYDEPIVLARNHGINLLIGQNPHATGGYVIPPESSSGCDALASGDFAGADSALTRCAIAYMLEQPFDSAALVPAKWIRLWAPFTGPRFEPANWQHPFDWRRFVPAGIRVSSSFKLLDVALSVVWATVGFLLFTFGAIALLRKANRALVGLALLPVVWLMAIHAITFGDPRFRIPVLPLILMFQIVGLVALAGALGRRSRVD